MTIIEVIEREGGNAAFSRRTGIPLRTVEDWKSGRRKCAAHWVRILSEWLDLPNSKNKVACRKFDVTTSLLDELSQDAEFRDLLINMGK